MCSKIFYRIFFGTDLMFIVTELEQVEILRFLAKFQVGLLFQLFIEGLDCGISLFQVPKNCPLINSEPSCVWGYLVGIPLKHRLRLTDLILTIIFYCFFFFASGSWYYVVLLFMNYLCKFSFLGTRFHLSVYYRLNHCFCFFLFFVFYYFFLFYFVLFCW